MSTEEMIARAEQLMASGAYREAHALGLQVMAAAPRDARAHFLIGRLAVRGGPLGQAAHLFEAAAALDPREAAYPAQLARCLLLMNRLAEARAAADRAFALVPADAESLAAVGLVYSRTGLNPEALGLLERAAAAQPDRAERHHDLGMARQFAGDFAGARAAFERAIGCDREFHPSWLSLVQLGRQTAEDNRLSELIALLGLRPDDPDRSLHLGHAIAKTLEDLGDYPAALEWLLRAKRPKRAAVRYSAADDEALFEAALSSGGPPPADADTTAAPIFVVGMPRTGTTLVDRILSSHPQVASLGELFDFMFTLKQMAMTRSPRALDAQTLLAASAVDKARLGRAYLQSVATLRAGAPRFVDKMPLNSFYAGLIHQALPGARIVCLRRDPLDTAVSNFRQMFGPAFPYYYYALSLEDAGRYALNFERLVAHWRAVLPPDRFTEVRYEDLVSDQERTTRDLLAFCGLPWDARCLAFHDHAGAVTTASAVQVRRPLHDRAVGRWRRYGEGLEPLLRVMAGASVSPPG